MNVTNRDYLIQNPSELTGKILNEAHDFIERVFGVHARMSMKDTDQLSFWLDAVRDYSKLGKDVQK